MDDLLSCPIGYTGEETLERYIIDHIDGESLLLSSLYRDTNIRLLNPRMASGQIQGRFLKMLTTMICPERVLEIGTFTAYSTICIAEGLSEGGFIHTVEIDDELEPFINKWIGESGYADRIELHIGDALKVVPDLGLSFDMVFIDGNKREYPEYYSKLFEFVRSGGYIVADNTLWNGHVADPERYSDRHTKAIRTFNNMVAADKRVEVAIVPLRDGLSIIRKK